MAEQTLLITLTAENKQALSAMKETVLSLDGVEKAAGKTGNGVKKMGTDFTGMSRVIQDLPYGFNAIANNLTNILPAAGALGLGISALVAGLQFAQIGFGNWTRGLGESKEALDAAKKANDDYIASLAKEQVSLDTLFRTATNANVPLAARLDAVKQLRDNYGAYLKNFTDEEILAGKAATAYTNLSAAIVQAARARAAQDTMVEKQKQILTLEQDIAKERERLEKRKVEIQKEGTTVTQTTMGAIGEVLTVETKLARADAGFIARTKEKTLALSNLNKEMQNLATQGQQNIVTPFKDATGKAKGETEESKEKKALTEMIKAREAYFAEIDRMVAQADLKRDQRRMKEMRGEFDVVKQEKAKPKDLTNLKLTMDGNAALNQIMQQQNEIRERQNANMALANSLTDTAMQGITGVFNAMANGQNIGDALGNMFKQLAVDIALAAAKAAIFQAILSVLNPAAGVGNAGGFLKGFGKLLGFAEGGTVSGPTTGYPVMLHGTEHIVRPDQMKSIIASAAQMGGTSGGRIEVYGKLQGQDIWLSQQRTNTFRGLTT